MPDRNEVQGKKESRSRWRKFERREGKLESSKRRDCSRVGVGKEVEVRAEEEEEEEEVERQVSSEVPSVTTVIERTLRRRKRRTGTKTSVSKSERQINEKKTRGGEAGAGSAGGKIQEV